MREKPLLWVHSEIFISHPMWHFPTIHSAMSKQTGFGEGGLFIEGTSNTQRERQLQPPLMLTSSFNMVRWDDGIIPPHLSCEVGVFWAVLTFLTYISVSFVSLLPEISWFSHSGNDDTPPQKNSRYTNRTAKWDIESRIPYDPASSLINK